MSTNPSAFTSLIPPTGDTSGALDTAGLKALLAAGGSGQLIPGQTYYVNAPLIIPPGQGLWCNGQSLAYYGGSVAMPLEGAIIKVAPGFTSASVGGQTVAGVFGLVSQTLGGYATGSGNQFLRGITVDGRSGPAGTQGLEAWGPVWGVRLEACGFYGLTGKGITTALSASDGTGKSPDLWHMHAVHAANCGSDGINLSALADSYISKCESTGNTGNAWLITNGNNTRYVGCKGENSTVGWNLVGTWAAGAYALFDACTSSGNSTGGFQVSGAGAGTYYLLHCHAGDTTPWVAYAGTNGVKSPAAFSASTAAPTLS